MERASGHEQGAEHLILLIRGFVVRLSVAASPLL